MWYDEEKDWDYLEVGPMTPGKVVEDFTQLVWRKTTHMAMVTAVNDDRLVVVARYSPKGNTGSVRDYIYNVFFPM